MVKHLAAWVMEGRALLGCGRLLGEHGACCWVLEHGVGRGAELLDLDRQPAHVCMPLLMCGCACVIFNPRGPTHAQGAYPVQLECVNAGGPAQPADEPL